MAPALKEAKRTGAPSDPLSFRQWLTRARVGDVQWTERDLNGLHAAAASAGRKVALRQFYAVNNDCEAVALVRVEVLA